MHSLSLREIASHFAHKKKQGALRILRVLSSREWEKPYEHLTTDARSRVAHIANRVLFGDKLLRIFFSGGDFFPFDFVVALV
jgi:hypothetical protein